MSINLRAAASCIPFIGPQIAVVNYANLKKDLKSTLARHETEKEIAKCAINLFQSDSFKKTLVETSRHYSDDSDEQIIERNTKHIEQQNEKITTADSHIKNIKIPAFKKGRICAAGGLVGNVLTTAILISIIVATAFSGVLVVGAAVFLSIMLACSIGLSIHSGYELYTFNKNLKALQAT